MCQTVATLAPVYEKVLYLVTCKDSNDCLQKMTKC